MCQTKSEMGAQHFQNHNNKIKIFFCKKKVENLFVPGRHLRFLPTGSTGSHPASILKKKVKIRNRQTR